MEAVPSNAETSSFGQGQLLRWPRLVRKMPEPQQRCTAVHRNRPNEDYYLLWVCVIGLKWKTSIGCSAIFVGLPSHFSRKRSIFFFFLALRLCLQRQKTLLVQLPYTYYCPPPVAPLRSFTLLIHDRKKLNRKKLSISQVAKFSRCFVLLWSWHHSWNDFLEMGLNKTINMMYTIKW